MPRKVVTTKTVWATVSTVYKEKGNLIIDGASEYNEGEWDDVENAKFELDKNTSRPENSSQVPQFCLDETLQKWTKHYITGQNVIKVNETL